MNFSFKDLIKIGLTNHLQITTVHPNPPPHGTNSVSRPSSPLPPIPRSPVLPMFYASSGSIFPIMRPKNPEEVEVLHSSTSEVADSALSRASTPFQVPRKPLPAYLGAFWHSPKFSSNWDMNDI